MAAKSAVRTPKYNGEPMTRVNDGHFRNAHVVVSTSGSIIVFKAGKRMKVPCWHARASFMGSVFLPFNPRMVDAFEATPQQAVTKFLKNIRKLVDKMKPELYSTWT